ncbi:MAG: hypothetical protein IM531_02550 [Pseudanabaena sp. M090S1SP1A06QC]|nr:hypothetical protein [Pseudanabaena sp. M109S1SP1A06QC]MCA6613579.1 hypothetical protein [Pseudanabaena sp. M090S1SP1A06QC]
MRAIDYDKGFREAVANLIALAIQVKHPEKLIFAQKSPTIYPYRKRKSNPPCSKLTSLPKHRQSNQATQAFIK